MILIKVRDKFFSGREFMTWLSDEDVIGRGITERAVVLSDSGWAKVASLVRNEVVEYDALSRERYHVWRITDQDRKDLIDALKVRIESIEYELNILTKHD